MSQTPKIAYIMSRFPKLTETFILYEMVAIENEGATVELYPLLRQRGPTMHAEAVAWLKRAHFVPLLSGPIARANLHFLARRPGRYWSTLFLLLLRTWGSARYFVGGLVFFPKAVYFARRMMADQVNHVHAHFANHPAAVAWVIHRLSGIPYSFTAHGSDLHRDRHMLKEKVAESAFVVAISQYNREVILNECPPGAGAKVTVLHCGVDVRAFRPGSSERRVEGGDRALTVFCVGTLHEVKGQTYLIEACRRLTARGFALACHFIGDGPDQRKLAQQAERAGIGDRVHFRGRLTSEEVREALRGADVLAAPSVPTRSGRREGIPVALMEAMGTGVPVVASRISGIPELVEDGATGLLAEPRDVEGLARAIERLLRDEGLRRRLGAAGRVKVENEFDLSKSAATLMRLFLADGEGRTSALDRAAGDQLLAPRLDWRFLIANPELGRVGFVGRRREALLKSLRLAARSVTLFGDAAAEEARGGPADGYELVLACEPSEAELRVGAGRVRPGGMLVVELRGARLRSPRGIAAHLTASDFEGVRSYWHWPSFDRCTRIIPLDDLVAARYALTRAATGAWGRVWAWLGLGLVRTGLIGWAVGCVSVIGRRAGASEPAQQQGSVVHAFLAKEAGRLNPSIHPAAERYSFVILTPRFRNSSHLIFLLLPEGETEPALVAKVPRHRGQCSSTLGEAEQLRLIQARRPTGFDSVPRLVACAAMDGRTILLETAMRGRAMDRATVRRNASRCCEAVLEWLIDVQTATRMGPEPGGNDLGRLIERDLLDVQAAIPAEAGLLEKTRALVAPLSRASVPRVLEHGDLSHPNLLLGPEGRLGVIDWELADLHGLPATDLYFFLTYVGMALKGGPTIPNALSAVDQAFFGQRSWARSYVRRYTESLGLPRDTLTPLFIACWARQVAGLVRRVGNGGDGSEWLRGNWRFAAWRHAVDEAGRLDWEDLP